MSWSYAQMTQSLVTLLLSASVTIRTDNNRHLNLGGSRVLLRGMSCRLDVHAVPS